MIIERGGLDFHWNGAHTVNVREHGGSKDLDCFTVGDMSKDAATPLQVGKGITQYLKDREETAR